MTNALKGHAMKRGTLMVLKRLFVTALSALGIGALAGGPAFGQDPDTGNIPAPDLFNDQITCINNLPPASGKDATLPTVPPRATDANPNPPSDLDLAIGMGTTTITDHDVFADLTFIVPPANPNCGQRTDDGTVVTTAFDPDAKDGEGPIAYDVAKGYSEVLDAFMDVYGDTGTAGDLEDALKALSDAETDASNYDDLEEEVDDARKADREARAALNAISDGPVYQAGIAEWMAKGAVEKAVEDYDEAVGDANAGRTFLRGLTYDEYTQLIDNSLAESVVTANDDPATRDVDESNVDLTALRLYANAAGGNEVNVNEDGETQASTSNFDDTGKLHVPVTLTDHDDDGDTDEVLRPVLEAATTPVGDVMTRVNAVNGALKTLKKKAADNENSLLQPLFDEAVRRAEAEADFYDDQLSDMLGNRDNKNTDVQEDDDEETWQDESEKYSINSINRDFQTASNKRAAEEEDLRAAARAREAATSNVVGAFTSPASFYQQLVDRREALKAAADNDIAEASEDGGTPGEDLTDAATAAAESLEDAREVLADYQALVGDDEGTPARALIDELLKGKGDDGKALVEAISSNYDTANDAKTTADAAKTKADEVEASVAGLTGAEGAVSTNTANIAENADGIVALDGRVTQNEDDIAGNTTMIGENRTMIGANTTNIAANATNIAANTGHIMENRGMIETNAGDIMTNAGNISMNSGRIDANEMGIASNASSIADNASMIGSNSASISDNRNMIGELSESLEVVRAGVAASMALAGMPAINGRGISIGVGSFDGESAFAVGFQIQGEMASFKVGLTSGGGATGASAGVGFQF